MKILITNFKLDHRSGTEIVVRDLEEGLRARGHDVCVFAPRPGVVGDEIVSRGGYVVDAIEHVPFSPDVIHGNDNGSATEAALRFPSAAVVFVCHGRYHWTAVASGIPSVREYVAVDLSCRERLILEGVRAERIHVIPNAVDLKRFSFRDAVTVPPRRAAVFGNNAANGGFVESVRHACAARALSLDEFGSGLGRTLDRPEIELAAYDVVFAKARCAIEAMAAGCAVIAIDEAGYGGLVTSANVEWMLDWNIGDRCLQRRHDDAAIEADLARIDASDVAGVCDLIRSRCSLVGAVDAYERVYLAAVSGESTSESAKPITWRDPYATVIEYASELEGRLRGDEGPWSMQPLPPSAAQAVSIAIVDSPRRVAPSTAFTVDVEVVNDSREFLASIGATPVHLAYHWLDGDGRVIELNGRRTQLTSGIKRGGHHRQAMGVDAPNACGEHVLQATLVQENVTWFSMLPDPVVAERRFVVAEQRNVTTVSEIADLCGLVTVRDALVTNLGFVSALGPNTLTFATTERHVEAAIRGGCGALVVPATLSSCVPVDVGLIESDAPARTFWEIHQLLSLQTDFYGADEETRIHRHARVHPNATIDRRNVLIDEDATVDAGCVINGRVTIERGARIMAGSVIGAAGFQTVRTGDEMVDFNHVGGVIVGEGAIVFANATIARGLFRQNSVIGEQCRIGNNAFVSHNAQVGSRTIIGHGAVVNGNVTIGADVWIGPGASIANNVSIGDGARVDLGATVIGSVAGGDHVGGPPAIDHHTVLREVARWRSRRRR